MGKTNKQAKNNQNQKTPKNPDMWILWQQTTEKYKYILYTILHSSSTISDDQSKIPVKEELDLWNTRKSISHLNDPNSP